MGNNFKVTLKAFTFVGIRGMGAGRYRQTRYALIFLLCGVNDLNIA